MPLPSWNLVSANCSQLGNATSMQSRSIILFSSFPLKFAFLQINCFNFRVSFFFIFPLLPALNSLDTPCPLRVSHPPLASYILFPTHPFPSLALLLLEHNFFGLPLSATFSQTLPFPVPPVLSPLLPCYNTCTRTSLNLKTRIIENMH